MWDESERRRWDRSYRRQSQNVEQVACSLHVIPCHISLVIPYDPWPRSRWIYAVVGSLPRRTSFRTIFNVRNAHPTVRFSTRVPAQGIYPTPTSSPLGNHPTVWWPEIQRRWHCHLAAIPRSGWQRSNAQNLATWQPSHGQAARDRMPMMLPLGSHPTVGRSKIRRPRLGHLAAIPR